MAGRLFTCGDIHGCFDILMEKLEEVNFDKENDTLVALGDLVDRGPDSFKVAKLLLEPWFKSIKGNHEQMAEMACQGLLVSHHMSNGGKWLQNLDATEKDLLVDLFKDLPVAMTVFSPSGRKIGFVHADLVGTDWDSFIGLLDSDYVVEYAMWERHRIKNVKKGIEQVPIKNVDHVFFGHTPLKEPRTSGNMTWIDTGCFATGVLTLIEIE